MSDNVIVNLWIESYRENAESQLSGKMGSPIPIREALWRSAKEIQPKNPARELKKWGLDAEEVADIKKNHSKPVEEIDIVDALVAQESNSVLESFAFVDEDISFEKKTLEEILQLSELINPKEAADEVIVWLTENVANFIDNKDKFFKLDLVIDEESEEGMTSIKRLQDLYRALPDDSDFVDTNKSTLSNFSNVDDSAFDQLVNCRVALNSITKEIHSEMRKSEKRKDLFNAMIFFYEMVGINQGQPLLKKLSGSVDIIEFDYEAFSVGVRVLGGFHRMEDDINAESSKQMIRQYTIPEGFTIAIEISYVDKARSLTLF